MKKINFADYEEFSYDIIEKFNSFDDKYDDISVISKYKHAKEIIKVLIACGYDIASIELEYEDIDGYYDEYVVTLDTDKIWCEKFKRDGKYLNDESTITYIMDDCSSNVINHCNGEHVYEVSIGCDECDSIDSDSCEKREDMHGFSVNGSNENGNYSYSFYTTEKLEKSDIKDILDKFGFSLK